MTELSNNGTIDKARVKKRKNKLITPSTVNPGTTSPTSHGSYDASSESESIDSFSSSVETIQKGKERSLHSSRVPIKIPKEFDFTSPPIQLFENITSTFFFFFKMGLRLLTPCLGPLVSLLLIVGASWYGIYLLRNVLHSNFLRWTGFIPSISNPFETVSSSLSSSTSFLSSLSIQSLSLLYCSTIRLGCGRAERKRLERETELSSTAREVTQQATQALDLFQSVLNVGESNSLSDPLTHVSIWELGVAVRSLTRLGNRHTLGSQLEELGDLTRDVKLELMRLDSYAMSSFNWILHEFNRLESLLNSVSNTPSRSLPRQELESLLSSLFLKISNDLTTLLLILDTAIPLSDRASITAGFLYNEMSSTQGQMKEVQGRKIDWSSWIPILGSSWEARQLRQDIFILSETLPSLKSSRRSLEATKLSLLAYSNNVGQFKAGLLGYHLAGKGLGLSVEEEVKGLGEVMREFRETVDSAKRRKKIGVGNVRKALPGGTVRRAPPS